MDDPSLSTDNKSDSRLSPGMQACGVEERRQFGQDIRLAMACMEGTAAPVNTKSMPSDEVAIRNRLKVLSQDIASDHADLLELLVRYDDMEGWAAVAANNEENERALKQWNSRSLRWDELASGSTRIQLILPPQIARAFLADEICTPSRRATVNGAGPLARETA